MGRMASPDSRDVEGFLVVRGRGAAPGLACGPLRRNRADRPPTEITGGILVAERAVPDDVARILAAAGTLTVSGALLSHVSLLSREFGRPSVSLGERARSRILADEAQGLLGLGDVVGVSGGASLDEGDIVFLDGGAGVLRVPGGIDAGSRLRVRAAHARLAAYATLPDDRDLLAAVVASCSDGHDPALAFTVEAALVFRLVPRGAPVRRLLAALRADPRLEAPIRRQLTGLLERIRERATDRCRNLAAAAESATDMEELDRDLKEVERALAGDLAIFEDVGEDPDWIEIELDELHRVVASRRSVLRARVEDELAAALAMPDAGIENRMGSLFRVLRRARAANLDRDAIARLHERIARRLADERSRIGVDIVAVLDERAPRDRAIVGGKALGLLEVLPLLPDGTRLPRGFIVTSAAYRLHLLGETGEKLREASAAEGDEAAVSRRARAAVLAGAMPDEVRDEVLAAWSSLGSPRVAVRSSATIEDAPAGSLAGLFDTYLGVVTVDDLLDRIRWSWASLWNARALAALGASGLSPLRAAQAVLVQEMVSTRAAGVMFSRDPGGRPDTLVINATWGLGEGISQGEIPGDLYWVRRSSGELVARDIGACDRWILVDPAGGGTIEAKLPDDLRGKPCLGEDDLARLARLAEGLESETGRAQDVEFGFTEDGTLLVFQVRRVVPQRVR